MPDIRRILCPVDFSETSEAALRYGLDLAKKLGAEVHAAHVYQLPVYAMPDGAIIGGPELVASLTDRLQTGLKTLKTKYPEITTHLSEGVPHLEIARMAKELGAELIVMGTHGRTGVTHFLLGSVTERVVRTSIIPVLTVRT